jgi:hypothetical protein
MAKKAARRKRVEWSRAQVQDLKQHSRAKTPVRKMVKAMKRTERALRQKASALGLPLGHQR